jgi:hypothetical protein
MKQISSFPLGSMAARSILWLIVLGMCLSVWGAKSVVISTRCKLDGEWSCSSVKMDELACVKSTDPCSNKTLMTYQLLRPSTVAYTLEYYATDTCEDILTTTIIAPSSSCLPQEQPNIPEYWINESLTNSSVTPWWAWLLLGLGVAVFLSMGGVAGYYYYRKQRQPRYANIVD